MRRTLLFWFDVKEGTRAVKSDQVLIDGYDPLVVRFHVLLLAQRRLIDFEPIQSSTSDRLVDVIAFNLSWEGFEFLDAVRSDSTWGRVKKLTASAGVSSLDLLKDLAVAYARQILQAKLGIAA